MKRSITIHERGIRSSANKFLKGRHRFSTLLPKQADESRRGVAGCGSDDLLKHLPNLAETFAILQKCLNQATISLCLCRTPSRPHVDHRLWLGLPRVPSVEDGGSLESWFLHQPKMRPTKHFDWLVVTGTWLLFSHILGMSSSQLTHIFQRGRYTTNQVMCVHRRPTDGW